MTSPYQNLADLSRKSFAWLLPLIEKSDDILGGSSHGDLPSWRDAIQNLPAARLMFNAGQAEANHGSETEDKQSLKDQLLKLHPWRKGPLTVGGVRINTEWRSDLKWQRIASRLQLKGHRVLDLGCGNGYFGWRMLDAGAELVIGVDTTLVYTMQWLACRHFSGEQANYVLPLGIEDLPADAGGFDSVFSMGVLYHRRDQGSHLARLFSLAKPGGQVLLETLIIPGEEKTSLVPDGRYARMRNVWEIPTVSLLQHWLEQAGFVDIQTLDITATSSEEQRTTQWMRFESLSESLDPKDPGRTIEGHPAPLRAAILARVPV